MGSNPVDPRERKLPTWAQGLLTRLRADLLAAESEAHEASRAATLAQQRSAPNDATVTYDGPDGESYGLPGVTCVRVGDVQIEQTEDGSLLLDVVTGRLVLEPIDRTVIRIRSAR